MKKLYIILIISLFWLGLSALNFFIENLVLFILLALLMAYFEFRNIYQGIKYKLYGKGILNLFRILFWCDLYLFIEIGPPGFFSIVPYFLGLELPGNITCSIFAILYYLYLIARKKLVIRE